MRHREKNTTAALAVIAAALLVLMAVMSCGKENGFIEPAIGLDRTITITAFHADGTGSKNTLENGGTDLFWQPGDEIKLFRGSNSSQLTADISENSIVASFSGPDPEGEGEFIAVYPSSLASHCTDGDVNITIPCMQVAKAGSFAQETYITMGHSATTEMGFYSVCGGFRFTLSQEGIKRVAFESVGWEPIAGDAVAAFVDGRPALQNPSSTLGFSRIILDAPDGESFQTGKWYYIVAAPATLHKGFKLTFYKKDSWGVKTFTNAVQIKRGAFGSKQNVDSGVVFSDSEHEYVDLGLSVKWATCNVGATLPEEYGEHFAWGETEPKSSYNWSTYKWCNGAYNKLTKYCTNSSYGTVDHKTVLEPDDDAAHVHWGGNWRMPTDEEWMELRLNCTWTLINMNGINGQLVTSKTNGNSIFLPAAACLGWQEDAGFSGHYWSSSSYTDYSPMAWDVHFFIDRTSVYWGTTRDVGQSVRPVHGAVVPVTSIDVSAELELFAGETATLSASVQPANATYKNVTWSSSDESIATVDDDGMVTAISVGSATITVYSADVATTAECKVTVEPNYNGYKYVDLYLPSGLKWASCNVGATEPEDYGVYFAWGEFGTKWDYGDSTYKWCNGDTYCLTKYCTNSNWWDSTEPMDNKVVLDLVDDAAHVNWGGSWRMPTYEEWMELIENCTLIWTTQNGVYGCLVTGRKGNSIFLPAAGFWYGTVPYDTGSLGYYWSSSLDTDYPDNACSVLFDSDGVNWVDDDRFLGFSVRPVSE